VTSAFRHPALQGAAGVGAFIALTWPLFVFDRPLYVVGAFFVVWLGTIALLFVFSRAPEHDIEDRVSGAPVSEQDHAQRG
jgi:hypothetical protein